MAVNTKKVVLFIVEGPTDEDALSPVLKKIFQNAQNPNGTIEVYEIKKDTLAGQAAGAIQLDAYVNAINKNNTIYAGMKAVHGSSLNYLFNCEIPSLHHPESKVIRYRTDKSNPGVILYTIEDRKEEHIPEPSIEPSTYIIPLPAKESENDLGWVADTGLVLGGIGLVIIAAVLVLDDVSGVGVADNAIAAAAAAKAIQFFSQVFGSASCPAIN